MCTLTYLELSLITNARVLEVRVQYSIMGTIHYTLLILLVYFFFFLYSSQTKQSI